MIVRGRIATPNNDEGSGAKEKDFRRLAFLVAVLIGLILVITVRLFYLQIIQGALGDDQEPFLSNYSLEGASHRGLIIDRHGHILALNTFEYDVSASPDVITDTLYVADHLSPILGLSPDELVSLLKPEKLYVLLKNRVSQEAADAIISWNFRGINLKPKLLRRYPNGDLAAHLLGFVNLDSDGVYGLEGFYDLLLKGADTIPEPVEGGKAYYQGETVPIAFQQLALPQDGTHLVLTLDRNIQYLVEQELARAVGRYQADGGTIIVMVPKTGAILAMANYPSYDPNRFYEALDLHTNPAVGYQYEPGSVFKIITMAAGLDAGVITPDSTFFDSDAIEVGGIIIRNPDRRAHGLVTMTDILALSLNVGVAHIGTLLGEETFYAYLKDFGCGAHTGIDLNGEVAGTLKEPGGTDWYRSDLGTNSFGQGIAVTPLQMITTVAAVANGGRLMKPYVVERIVDDQGAIITQPTIVRQVVTSQIAEQLTAMLVEAVERGAELATVPGYDIAGKTGTAQIPVGGGYDPELTIASFVGYAPADDPQFIALVKIDKPRLDPWGGEVAAPVFRIIAERLFVLLDVPPDSVRLARR
ncbi:MAG: penicillin-binding protein 2 [Anaerolineales bacterium]|nr:penicillin-binding protein 2 [Anaerolineales bacterium]